VSAFSTWEKELHKIVFDPRYLLLTSKERKQVFEQYVKERAEEERREKRNKLKEKKEQFKQLLDEAHLTSKYDDPSSSTPFSIWLLLSMISNNTSRWSGLEARPWATLIDIIINGALLQVYYVNICLHDCGGRKQPTWKQFRR